MERLTKRITEAMIELSAKANPFQYNGSPQRVHMKHPFWNVFNRLCDYEDAEEQGLLLGLPCKVGDTVYFISRYTNSVLKGTVETIELRENFRRDRILIKVKTVADDYFYDDDFGKTVFLTKEEAEKAREAGDRHESKEIFSTDRKD